MVKLEKFGRDSMKLLFSRDLIISTEMDE